MFSKKLNCQIAVSLLIICSLGCSMLRPRHPLTWAVTLEIDAPAEEQDAALTHTVFVLKKRLDLVGVSNFEVEPQGNARIQIRLSDVSDRNRLKAFLISGGRLELSHVISPPSPAPVQTYNTREEAVASLGEAVPSNRRILSYPMNHDPSQASEAGKMWVVVESPAVVTGNDLRNARAIMDSSGGSSYSILFSLRPAGAQRLETWTAANINEYLAIGLNDEVKSIVYIKSQLSDQGEITGRFTKESAEDLAHVLNSGALPTRVKVVAETDLKQD